MYDIHEPVWVQLSHHIHCFCAGSVSQVHAQDAMAAPVADPMPSVLHRGGKGGGGGLPVVSGFVVGGRGGRDGRDHAPMESQLPEIMQQLPPGYACTHPTPYFVNLATGLGELRMGASQASLQHPHSQAPMAKDGGAVGNEGGGGGGDMKHTEIGPEANEQAVEEETRMNMRRALEVTSSALIRGAFHGL